MVLAEFPRAAAREILVVDRLCRPDSDSLTTGVEQIEVLEIRYGEARGETE